MSTDSVINGVKADTFASLSGWQRRALVKIMARIAERSYRRGVQQGALLAREYQERLPKSLAVWRFDISLDRSPWLEGARTEPSTERLFMENGELYELGFSRFD
jgi:hypothetical protein